MSPTKQLQKAQELVEAYKALEIPEAFELYVLRLFVEAMFPGFTVKRREN